MKTYGIVFDIKRFALHDGHSIRSTLFLKGCHLSCPWCQNPEGLDSQVRLRWTSTQCIHCGLCIKACPKDALSAHGQNEKNSSDYFIKIDFSLCDNCGDCVEECPSCALSFDGRRVSSDEIAKELLRDKVFFMESGGGITLSGGEPLFQPLFAREVMAFCQNEGVSTAIETTLAVKRPAVEKVLDVTDQFLVDLKIADESSHRRWVGVSRKEIRSNLEYLLDSNANVLIRIPLIPGYTATEENLRGLGRYIASLKKPSLSVELLNFNPLAENKYRLLERSYTVSPNDSPSTDFPLVSSHNKYWPFPSNTPRFEKEEMNKFSKILESEGVKKVLV